MSEIDKSLIRKDQRLSIYVYMGTFSEYLDLRWSHTQRDGSLGSELVWVLLQDLTYTANDGTVYVVPKGFETDLASTPRPFWPMFPPFWTYSKAAVIHDYLLSSGVPFFAANKVMQECMVSLNVNRQVRFCIYISINLYAFVKTKILRIGK